MAGRVGTVALVAVIVAVGAFLGSAASQWWQPTGATAGDAPLAPVARERVRVEVLNGGGRAGVARAATDALREGGFDVVYFGNASSFGQDTSVVLDRIGRPELARQVAGALGIPRVSSQPDSSLYLDVTVVLGQDWSPAGGDEAGVEEGLPWWSPRRWLGEGESRRGGDDVGRGAAGG